MATSNPDTWTSPRWHSDWGNPEEELSRLQACAKALLRKCPDATVTLEQPEEGYMYVQVSHHSQLVAEVYCVKQSDKPDSLRYGVFVREGDDESENYCSTPEEAVELIAGACS
jgi:hypothetical protein